MVRSTTKLFLELGVQERIVDVLDTAHSSLNSLRFERDARHEQFVYYRYKLLSFPEKGASA